MIANSTGYEDIDSYRGLAWRGAVIPAVCLAVFLFSLTGLPPFAGFIGKFLLFAAVLKEGGVFVILALVAMVNSVVSLYYYAKIVKVMFLDAPDPRVQTIAASSSRGGLLLPLTALTALTFVFGIYFYPLSRYTTESLSFFVK